MHFLVGGRLALLAGVVVLAFLYVLAQRRRPRYAARFTNLDLLDRVAPARPAWRRHVSAVAFLSALSSSVVAFAHPTAALRVAERRATVVLAIDTSLSMQAVDVSPDRITAAKEAATAFLERLPKHVRLGLVTFSGDAQVIVTPTTDRAVLRDAIDRLRLGQGTAIGEAIFASLDAMHLGEQGLAPNRVVAARRATRIVVLSDGETTEGRPDAFAAAAARDEGVKVSTVAFGTSDGVLAAEGRLIPVPVNRPALRAIAEQTGGRSFDAPTEGALRSALEGVGSAVGFTKRQRDISAWFTGLALVLGAIAAAASLRWSSRLP